MSNIYNEMQLDESLVRIAQQANLERSCLNSCKPRKGEIKGECYVSKKSSRQDKIAAAKQVILGLTTLIVVGAGVKIAGDIDIATDIREEVTKKEATYGFNNGISDYDYAYDEGFVDAMINLNDGTLIKLFNETSKEMKTDGNNEEANIVSKVVEEMEENYIEEHGRAR